jgi:hypothetical protein
MSPVLTGPIDKFPFEGDNELQKEERDLRSTRGQQELNEGIWISQQEIIELPMSGVAWDALKAQADTDCGIPNISDQDQDNNVYVLAKALVYARTQNESYRTEVRDQLALAIDTELGGRTLALGRELAAYVISADLIDLPNYDASFNENEFIPWLKRCLNDKMELRTLRETHEDRPNNWGTHAGASRIATAIYLQNTTELDNAAMVFKGWLGDRDTYSDFTYKNLSWQADPANPVGINPMGSIKNGYAIDGILPDDMRRGGEFQFPPNMTEYPWEALQGATVQAQLLHRQGYDAWNWSDMAILRSAQVLYDFGKKYHADWNADGDDEWNVWLLNHAYGTSFHTETPTRFGKNMGWTDWTHGNRAFGNPPHLYPPLVLRKGWNLISISWIQNNPTLQNVLENISGSYDALHYYDNQDEFNKWKDHHTNKPFGNDLSEVNNEMGLWIHITQPGFTILTYNGSDPIQDRKIILHPGWNMVGYPSLTNHNRTVGLNNLTFDTHVDCIQWFDAATQTWHFMGPDDSFVPGRGYWVHSKVDAEWEVPL